jgi:hypothetical protein
MSTNTRIRDIPDTPSTPITRTRESRRDRPIMASRRITLRLLPVIDP